MPEGPYGGPRPFAECNIELLVAGNPDDPPTKEETIQALSDAGLLNGVNNIVEQNFNTDKIDNMASMGTQQIVVVELPSDSAISVNQDWDTISRFNENILSETGGAVFIVAR